MKEKRNSEVTAMDGGLVMRRYSLVLILLLVFAACAQTQGTIDRVQNNLVKKEDLLYTPDGSRKEWFYRSTVIRTPYASAYTFVGDQGPLERGVFDIQENYLLFYRTYTFTENEYNHNPRADVDVRLKCKPGIKYCDENNKQLIPNCDCDGFYLVNGQQVWMDKNAPIVAYPIEKHVDVIWDYNPNTGERTNVRVENETDRLWWEREYMRVFWGGNDLANKANVPQNTDYGLWNPQTGAKGAKAQPFIFRDESSAPDEEPEIHPEEGRMGFVTEWVIQSPTVDYPGFGQIPLCWFYPFYSGGIFECTSEQIGVRSFYLQVDPAREAEYEPLEYSDFDMARFGYFRTERLWWDKDYGTTYTGILRYANRFDIWKKDKDGKVVGLRPIVYYLSEGFPDDLVEDASQVADAWNDAFVQTVKAVTGKSPKDFGVDRMFVLCENNRKETAARTGAKASTGAPCEVTDEPKRNGDLRYSFIYAVTEPVQYGLYGFGPASADPLSGRIVSASAYMYVAAMKEGANRAMDVIDVLTGAKNLKEVRDALYISHDVKYKRLRDTYWRQGFTTKEAEDLAKSLVPQNVGAALTSTGVPKSDGNFSQARMNIIAQFPELERMLNFDDINLLFKDPRITDKSGAATDSTSAHPLRSFANHAGFKGFWRSVQQDVMRGLDREEFYDGALIRLAEEARKAYDQKVCGELWGRSDLAYDWGAFESEQACSVRDLLEQLRQQVAWREKRDPYGYNETYIVSPLEVPTDDPVLQRTQIQTKALLDSVRAEWVKKLYESIFQGVALHEVGHTLGLRHNFEASTDALNFPKQYWQLKVRKDSDKYVPVAAFSESVEQEKAGMREYQYSSVMDYFLKFDMPWHGIGLYDIAAIKYGHGQIMEVFETNPKNLAKYQAYMDVEPPPLTPGATVSVRNRGERLGKLLYVIHPTEIPNLFGEIDAIYRRQDVPKSEVIGKPCAKEGEACPGGKVCKRFFEGLRCSLPQDPVPYRFGGDEEAGLLPTVDVWDEGVDPYEIVQNNIEVLDQYWTFRGYWHQDPTFWPDFYYNFVRSRYYAMRDQYQWFVLGYASFNKDDYWKTRFGKRWEEDVNGGLSWALASFNAFQYLVSQLGRPTRGVYGYNVVTQRFEPYDQVNFSNYQYFSFMLEENGARPIYSQWDYSGYLPYVVSAGSIYDRIAAMEVLTDPETETLAADTAAESQRYLINFGTVFGNELREVFGGLMANNSTKYGWCVLMHDYQTKSRYGPIGFAPGMRINTRTGVANSDPCSYTYCGKVDEQREVITDLQPARDPDNPDDPCGPELTSKGYVHLDGVPLEPEPRYIFPTTQYRIPMLAAYYGLSLLVNNFDKSFMDATRVWLEGEKAQIDVPADAILATCEDRFSGRIYHAYALPDGGYYPAYDLVEQCNLIFSCYDEKVNKTLDEETIKECARRLGKSEAAIPNLTLDDLRNEYLFHDLQFLLGKLELIRAMYGAYEYGYTGPVDVVSGS